MAEEEASEAASGGAEVPAASSAGVPTPFLLVLVFFAMGLLGFLACRALKKKGYRCRTLREPPDGAERALRHQQEPPDDGAGSDEDEVNEDTVEKIVQCIIQNEANVEVLKGLLLAEGEGDTQPPPPPGPGPLPMPSFCLHRSSQDGGLPHHHTVHLGSTQAPCMHCSQKKKKRRRHPLQRQGRSKDGKSKMHPGETTVFSVGRFHVTHIGKKPASHDSKEDSLPDSKQDLGSGDLDGENWEGSPGGATPVDRLHLARSQEAAGAQSGSELTDVCKDKPTEEDGLLKATASPDVTKNGLERRKHPNTDSSQQEQSLTVQDPGVCV